MRSISFLFIIAIILLQNNCMNYSIKKNSESVKSIYDPEADMHIYIYSDNDLPLTLDDMFKIKKLSFNPVKIIKEKSNVYYMFEFYCGTYTDLFKDKINNKLEVKIDGRNITLYSSSSGFGKNEMNEISIYYEIDVLDLIEMSSAKYVAIKIYNKDFTISKELSDRNIQNIKKFVHDNVFSLKKSNYRIKEKEARGFIAAGKGNGYNIWIALHTGFLKLSLMPELKDYLALGAGYHSFKYKRYYLQQYDGNVEPPFIYYDYLDSHDSDIWNINLMYGVTHPSRMGSCSFELGITMHYYNMVDKKWNRYVEFDTEDGSVPEIIYKINRGKTYNGFAIGGFIQIGSFWFMLNTQEDWCVGLSLPIKF